jgi:hypothetical protein
MGSIGMMRVSLRIKDGDLKAQASKTGPRRCTTALSALHVACQNIDRRHNGRHDQFGHLILATELILIWRVMYLKRFPCPMITVKIEFRECRTDARRIVEKGFSF